MPDQMLTPESSSPFETSLMDEIQEESPQTPDPLDDLLIDWNFSSPVLSGREDDSPKDLFGSDAESDFGDDANCKRSRSSSHESVFGSSPPKKKTRCDGEQGPSGKEVTDNMGETGKTETGEQKEYHPAAKDQSEKKVEGEEKSE